MGDKQSSLAGRTIACANLCWWLTPESSLLLNFESPVSLRSCFAFLSSSTVALDSRRTHIVKISKRADYEVELASGPNFVR